MVPACSSGTLTIQSASTLECNDTGTGHDTPSCHRIQTQGRPASFYVFGLTPPHQRQTKVHHPNGSLFQHLTPFQQSRVHSRNAYNRSTKLCAPFNHRPGKAGEAAVVQRSRFLCWASGHKCPGTCV